MEATTINCCPGNGCHEGCIHRTVVEDGRIIKVERLTYPDGAVGDICVKGVAGARLPYNPERLQYPLKRIGVRGEGKWERITWEQALDEIADQLKQIREQYQPESILMFSEPNSQPNGETQVMLGERLRKLLGALPWMLGSSIDSNPFFAAFMTFGHSFGHYMDPRTLVEGKSRQIIMWGCNPAEMSARVWRFIKEAQQQGAKVVDIGVIADPSARASDSFVRVMPGSDGAIVLAMIGVIIGEQLYDEHYVKQYTNGPFLVRGDNGKLLRESDISPEGSPCSYVVWDETSGGSCSVAPRAVAPSGVQPVLLGTFRVRGIECKPAFQRLADCVRDYPAERAAEISGVPAETIHRLAREYADAKPAAIVIRNGLRYMNGGNTYRAIDILAAITGNSSRTGGGVLTTGGTHGVLNAPKLRLNDAAVLAPPIEKHSKDIPQAHFLEAMSGRGANPIKAMIVYACNPIHTHPNQQRWFEELLPNLELIVVNDIFMTQTAEFADYVLPDCTLYERDDLEIGTNGHLIWVEKAIEPMYDCRPPIFFWSELAKRLGYGEYFDKTLDEWTEVRLDSKDPSIAGIQPPLSLERLKKEKIVKANVSVSIVNRWHSGDFPTPSGKIELYNEELLPADDALPAFHEQLESPRSPLAKKYPLVFLTANNKYFTHTLFANDPGMHKQYMKEPQLSINPVDAQARGIASGDTVRVVNDRGSLTVKAMLTETLPAGTVHIPNGWWPKHYIDGHPQRLVLPHSTLNIRHKSQEIFWELSVARTKPGVRGLHHGTLSYSPDTIFDCLCEVSKS